MLYVINIVFPIRLLFSLFGDSVPRETIRALNASLTPLSFSCQTVDSELLPLINVRRYNATFRTSYIDNLRRFLRCSKCWIIISSIEAGSVIVNTEVVYPSFDSQGGEVPLDASALVSSLSINPQLLFDATFVSTYGDILLVPGSIIATFALPPPEPPQPPR